MRTDIAGLRLIRRGCEREGVFFPDYLNTSVQSPLSDMNRNQQPQTTLNLHRTEPYELPTNNAHLLGIRFSTGTVSSISVV